MLVVISGTDFEKRTQALRELISVFSKDHPQAHHTRIEGGEVSVSLIQGLLRSSGLFDVSHLVVLRGITEEKETWEIVRENLEAMKYSSQVWVCVEDSLDAKTKKEFSNVEADIRLYDRAGISNNPFENRSQLFKITDAVSSRSLKNAWISLEEARMNGFDAHEIFGVVRWCIKSLLIVSALSHGGRAEDSGLKPFVYAKMRKAVSLFTTSELVLFHRALVDAFHDDRAGIPLSESLERIILTAVAPKRSSN